MDFEIKIDENYKLPKALVYTDKVTEEVLRLKSFVLENSENLLIGFLDEKIKILKPAKIYRIYTEDSRVFAESLEEKYLVKKRIYQLEEMLKAKNFVRISNSELINLNLVDSFDLSYSGTISVTMKNKSKTFVSRRYVKKIKTTLGIWGDFMKKIISRMVNGLLICEFVLLVISLIMSYIFADGDFSLANPSLIESSKSVFAANFLSICLSGLLGMVFGFASVVWEEEKLSILTRTIIHFLLTASTMVFVGYKLYWFQKSSLSLAIFLGIYLLIYLVIWFVEYTLAKRDIARLNEKLKNNM